MWMGNYEPVNLIGLLIQSIFIENILLISFLGMCTYLACSSKLATANGLGLAVVFVLTVAGVLNWFVHAFVTGPGALSWLQTFGLDTEGINLNFLEFLLFISVIAAFVQVLEMIIERFSPALYNSLGMYLPLITVNCAILGACLFAVTRNFPFIPNLIYIFGSGVGWWLAIALIAAIRQKLEVSNVPPLLRGMGITFIASGLMSMAFSGFTGIKLANPSGETISQPKEEVVLSFNDDLTKFEGEVVAIRGFLYEADDHTYLLAPEPNLKTCCLGKKEQIHLLGDFTPSALAQTVKGKVVIQGNRPALLELNAKNSS